MQPMKFFVRAVVSGFGFSLGAALYKKVSKRFGLDEPDKDKAKVGNEPERGVSDLPDTDTDDTESPRPN